MTISSAIFAALALASGSTQPTPPPRTDMPEPVRVTNPVAIPTRQIEPEQFAETCKPWDDWDKPVEPFVVTPGLYYVGTCGIAALYIPTRHGDILIDTGTEEGAKVIYDNLTGLRRVATSIGLILFSHEHFDHVGGLALMQRMTRAPVLAAPAAAQVLRTGKDDPRDPQAGMHGPMEPAPNVIAIEPGVPVTFGGIAFTPIATPGHTPGALSWQWEMCDPAGTCRSVVYADSLSPVSADEYRFSDDPDYVAQYRAGLQRLREAPCDILLTPHPSASRMLRRAATGSFEGGMTCIEYADAIEKRLDQRLAREAQDE